MHAYLIIAHNQFELLKKVIESIDDIRNDIYIHIDSKSDKFIQSDFENLSKKSKIYFLDRINVVWGHYSQIQCELMMIKEAIRNNNYEYLHLISGVDLPIKSQDYIHSFFSMNKGKEFIHIESEEISQSNKEKYRYFFPLQKYIGNRKDTFLYYLQRGIIYIQKMVGIRRNKKIENSFYKGCNWFSITSDFARYTIEHEEWIRNTFKYTLCCDEIFIQTILMNSPFREKLYISNFCDDYIGCMRYIDWDRGTPYTFTIEDYDELVKKPHIFARKFNIDLDRDIIEKLIKYIKGEE